MIEPAASSSPLRNAALAYAQRGFHVFPIYEIDERTGWCACSNPACDRPGKHPRTTRGLNDSTIDLDLVERYWAAWPHANIGIDCGRSGLAVLDVDVKRGAQGAATMKWVLERHADAFAACEVVSSPSGGYHYYFAGAIKTGQGTLGPGVDTRGVGGYVLAPPSTTLATYDDAGRPIAGVARPYTLLRSVPTLPPLPNLAPQSVMTLGSITGEGRAFEGEARAAVPHGEHRQALLWLAWHLRRVHGLTVEAGVAALQRFIDGGLLEGYTPTDPFTERDLTGMLERIEPMVASAPPELPSNPLEGVINGDAAQAHERPLTFLIPHFVPLGELMLLFGDGGVGKSTWFSWLAAQATQMGLNFGVAPVEEPFSRFVARARAMGADASKIFGFERAPIGLKFAEHAEYIERFVDDYQISALYFDSLKTHFVNGAKGDAAAQTRENLGPLADLAQRTGCGMYGTFHQNKEKDYSGSTEMLNVPRVVLEAALKGENTLHVKVRKGNFKLPTFKLAFERHETPYLDAVGRQVMQVFKMRGGPDVICAQSLPTWERIADASLIGSTLEDIANANTPAHRGPRA